MSFRNIFTFVIKLLHRWSFYSLVLLIKTINISVSPNLASSCLRRNRWDPKHRIKVVDFNNQ